MSSSMIGFEPNPCVKTVALGSIGLLFLGSTLASILAFLVVELFHGSKFVAVIAALLAGDAWCLARYAWLSPRRGWTDLRHRFAPIDYRVVIGSTTGGVASVCAFLGLEEVFKRGGITLGGIPTPPYAVSNWSQLPAAVLAIVIIGPLAEELLFRGLFLDWLRQRMHTWAAVVIVSVVFSLAHGIDIKSGLAGWLQCTYRLLTGMIAAILTVKFHSLRPSFVFHATNNLIGVGGMLFDSHG